jgi:omega-hydroxy-beta-dihydromenaquinone-9 sulfotransferase
MVVQLKHRWSISHNYLAGLTAAGWYRLLRDNKFQVDWPYWHRAAFITVASLINSLSSNKEKRLYDSAVGRVKITQPPLFILGHWRSGTTLLHNLLAQDQDQFAYANTYQVVNPHTFLSTEEINGKLFAALVPKKRPMDNMELSFQTPQEDEFAPCLLTFRSLYLGISFPRREDFYSRYLAFRGVAREELEEWKAGFLWFLKKLTYKYRRALVLKSPPHTARIRILLDMFPNARFVHIHRDPYAVFQSSRHYFDTATWYTYLQRPKLKGMDERIVHRYTALYNAFFEDKALIPADQFHEVRFEDLEQDPFQQLRVLYEKLGLTGFQQLEPKLKAYVASLSNYRKNEFPELTPALRQMVAEHWGRSFDEWGYVR